MKKGQIFVRGILKDNPVLVMMLGLCPILATSGTVRTGLGMGIAASLVLILSNISISIIRKQVRNEIRIIIFVIIIATYVTIVDYFMQAYQPDLRQALGVFVPLIAINCMILNRAESFAQKNSVFASTLDGLGMGVGFTLALVTIASIREILGHGTFLGMPLLGKGLPKFSITFMILPPGAFLVLAVLMALVNRYTKKGYK